MDDNDPKTDNIDSHKRVNLFVRHAKKASAGPQLILGRTLLKNMELYSRIEAGRKKNGMNIMNLGVEVNGLLMICPSLYLEDGRQTCQARKAACFG